MKTLSSLLLLTFLASATLEATPPMAQRTNLRNARYGEIVLVTGGPFHFVGHVYNTIGLGNCPEAQWKALNPEQLKKHFRARSVILNGPRYFLMDTNALANPGNIATFGGIQARHLADVDVSLASVMRGKVKPYTENTVDRTSRYIFKKGLPVFELVDPDGATYVMQSYARIVNPKLSYGDLPGLGSSLKLPKGWKYQTRVPTQDLVLTTSGTACVIQDDLANTYQRTNQNP